MTAGALNIAGDLFSQLVVEKQKKAGLRRLATFGLLGVGLVGPALHFWYGALGKIIPYGGTVGAAARLVLDQGLFAPFFIASFMAALLTLEGRVKEVPTKLTSDLQVRGGFFE